MNARRLLISSLLGLGAFVILMLPVFGQQSGQVQGVAGVGSAVPIRPVAVGGADGSGNAKFCVLDSSGNLDITVRNGTTSLTTALGLKVQGNTASGVATAGAPVLTGGQDGTNTVTHLVDSSGRQVVKGTQGNTSVAVSVEGSLAANSNSQQFPVQMGALDRNGKVQASRCDDLSLIASPTVFALEVRTYPAWLGTQANAWNAASVSANGTSTALHCLGIRRIECFGNTSGATNITIQFSQDNTNWYTATTPSAVAANGNFSIGFETGADYVRMASSAAVTITATIAGKG